jgi:hypothetical protein
MDLFAWEDRITHICSICGCGYKWVSQNNPITVCLKCGGAVKRWDGLDPENTTEAAEVSGSVPGGRG